MNAKARTARQIIKTRRAEAAAAKAPHTLVSHTLRAGVDAKDAGNVAGALRGRIAKTGVCGIPVRMFRTNAAGQKIWRQPVKNARRFTRNEFGILAAAYAPRLDRYVAARESMLAYAK